MKKDNILAVSVLLLAIFLCSLFSFKEGVLSISLFSIFFSIIGMGIVRAASKGFNRDYLVKLFLWGYSLRILITITLYLLLITFRGEPFLGGGDDFFYNKIGEILSEIWVSSGFYSLGQLPELAYRSFDPGYFYVNAFFRYISNYIGGGHLAVPILFNCLIGALIPIYVYKIAFRVYNEKIANISALFAAFFPTMVLYSSVLLKDTIIIFLITLIAWYTVNFHLGKNKYSLVMLALLAVPIAYLRGNIFLPLSLFVALCVLLSSISSRNGKITRVPAAISIIAMGIVFFSYQAEQIEGGKVTFRVSQSLEKSKNFLEFMKQKASTLEKEPMLGGKSITSLIYNSPWPLSPLLRPLSLLIMPFPPWGPVAKTALSGSWIPIIEFPGLVWYILMPLWAFGLIYSIREKRLASFFVYGLNILCFSMVGYVEIGVRHRLMGMPLALILAAVGITYGPAFRRLVPLYVVFYSLLVLIYLFLKYEDTLPLQFLSKTGIIILITAYIIWKISSFRR